MPTTLEPASATGTNKVDGRDKNGNQFSVRAGRANFWNDSAPNKVIGENQWENWVRHLNKRNKPTPVDSLYGAKGTALAWGLEENRLSADLLKLCVRVSRKGKVDKAGAEDVLLFWHDGIESQSQNVDFAIECLAVAQLLPSFAAFVEHDLWWSLMESLCEIATRTGDWQIDAEMPTEDCLIHQLLAGELPLTLAYLFPEMRPLAKLRKAALDALSEGLIELTNGEGLPRATHLEQFRALLACWTRCRAMGGEMKKGSWSKKADEQYRWAVAKSVMLSSSTGEPLLANNQASKWSPDFLESALRLGGTSADRTAAFDMFEKKLGKHLSGKSGKLVPETSYQCEWAGLAILRTEFSRSAPVVAVDFATPELRIDVWSGSQRLFAGTWSTETISTGNKLEPVGVWEQTCWFSDEEVDYLELAIDLSSGARLERQILLARDDRFLFLADNVLDVQGDSIRHQMNLPLDSNIRFSPEAETREGKLVANKPLARVLPVALPEWRSDPRIGELTQEGDWLQLTQERPGKRLACPLVIDLAPARLDKQCTWRQLTVAQSLEIQPHDKAVGYRVQCGKAQWLIYRSLDAPMNRSVLGQNISVESLVGRFLAPGGEVEELLQVEG